MTTSMILLIVTLTLLAATVAIGERRSRRAVFSSIAIDMDALAQIESGNNPLAVSRAGARGLFQLTRAAWNDAVKSIAIDRPDVAKAIADYDQWVHDPTVSRVVAWEYITRCLPRYLASRRLLESDTTGPVPDSLDARLAAWNAGALRVRRAYAKSPANWQGCLPFETRQFISRYHAEVARRTMIKAVTTGNSN